MFELSDSGEEESEKHEATSTLIILDELPDSKSEFTESNWVFRLPLDLFCDIMLFMISDTQFYKLF